MVFVLAAGVSSQTKNVVSTSQMISVSSAITDIPRTGAASGGSVGVTALLLSHADWNSHCWNTQTETLLQVCAISQCGTNKGFFYLLLYPFCEMGRLVKIGWKVVLLTFGNICVHVLSSFMFHFRGEITVSKWHSKFPNGSGLCYDVMFIFCQSEVNKGVYVHP